MNKQFIKNGSQPTMNFLAHIKQFIETRLIGMPHI